MDDKTKVQEFETQRWSCVMGFLGSRLNSEHFFVGAGVKTDFLSSYGASPETHSG